jgi:hypothetical protein
MSNETKWDVFDAVWNRLAGYQVFFNGWPRETLDGYKKRYDNALPDNLPVISASVAEFIVWCKGQNTPLQDALYFESDGFMHSKQDEERIGGWITDHQDEFARAWLDGYEIDNKS